MAGTDPRFSTVELLLTSLHSSPVRIVAWEALGAWSVARVTVDGPIDPRTVIVKSARTGTSRSEPWRMQAEWAALRFLADGLGLTLAPRALAADLSAGLLILEDLAPRAALDQMLRQDGAAAHTARLTAFARRLGELNAATAGRADPHRTPPAALGTALPEAGRVPPMPASSTSSPRVSPTPYSTPLASTSPAQRG